MVGGVAGEAPAPLPFVPAPRRLRIGAGRAAGGAPEVRRDPGLPPQGYRLHASRRRVVLTAADDARTAYGRQTLAHLRRLYPDGLPTLDVEAWPDLPRRGFLLDISRDRVPTPRSLAALLDRLASWRVNVLLLHVENTVAYRGHEAAAPESALSLAEVEAPRPEASHPQPAAGGRG